MPRRRPNARLPMVLRRSSIPGLGLLLSLLLVCGLLEANAAPGRAQANNDTLIVAVASDMQNLDPTLSSADVYTQEMLTNVYDWLVDYDLSEEADGTQTADPNTFVGGLAERFEWSPDGTKITFTLRDGLKFSNGDPLTAEAVKFTFDRIFDQQGVTYGNMSMAAVPDKDHVKVIDEQTIEMTVDTPNTLLLGNMAQFGNSILNPAVVEPHMTTEDPYAHEWLKANTTGTEQGPFVLESWEPGNQWVLARNPNYWGEPPKLERIIFKVIPDPSSRLTQLQSGAVDIAYELPTTDILALEGDPNLQIIRYPSRFVVFLGMNEQVPPFDNKLVRQAISNAIPYETIVNEVLNGYGRQLTSPIPDGTPTHTDEFFVYKQDPEKAKELLTEAGFPDGFETTLAVASGNQEGKETAVWVQQSLAEIGITVNIQELPGAAFAEQLQKHELGFFFFNNWISINNDPFYHLYWLFWSPCCNYTNYSNPEVHQLIEEYTLSTDQEARDQAALDAQQAIVDDAPWVFLYQPDFLLAMRSNVKGYVFYSTDRFTRYKFLYKE
jgi:peptide/nickel transport system substrate-binding protein